MSDFVSGADYTTEKAFATPMMQQYLDLKRQYADCLLLFRLGDFYELFLDDAITGAKVLGITLTSRTRGKDGRIPMAGVPYHAVDTYLAKLVKAGYKVALCDQITPPGKGLVDRQVTRVVSPGTFLHEAHLDQKKHNYLLTISPSKKNLEWSAIDLSTGDSWFGQSERQFVHLHSWLEELAAYFEPQECLVPPGKQGQILAEAWQKFPQVRITEVPEWSVWEKNLRSGVPHSAVGIAEQYLTTTQKTSLTHLQPARAWQSSEVMHLPRSTVLNLELLQTLHDGETHGSVLNTIDQTVTPMGGRLLKHWLLHPLKKLAPLVARQEKVASFVSNSTLREQLRSQLRHAADFERIIARLTLGLGTPRDLAAIRDSLSEVFSLAELLPAFTKQPLDWAQTIQTQIQQILVEDPPTDPRQGGLINPATDPDLSRWHETVTTHQTWMSDYEQTIKNQTGITTLKVRYNQVFGYYIEVSKANSRLVPDTFQRTQTLVNAERFTTPELRAHEQQLLEAQTLMIEREYALFTELVRAVLAETTKWQTLAQDLAELDCVTALAELAIRSEYHQPTLVETGELTITQGRHPVVERLLPPRHFIPNDVHLSTTKNQVLILTGPNMAGKSVFMRQVALITLLAQIGSFVPAKSAQVSVCDQIFVRSGASDRITAGQSTFMVEMAETAAILAQATPQSLIVMDEIGRGTSTYDGISIAWAVVEYLQAQPQGPKTLFATHYHELQVLAERFPEHVVNGHLAITQHQGKPVFLYQLKPGGASHSFGVAVAELAGLPPEVLDRAKTLLQELEQGPRDQTKTSAYDQASGLLEPSDHAILNELAHIDLDTITPLQALTQLSVWKTKL